MLLTCACVVSNVAQCTSLHSDATVPNPEVIVLQSPLVEEKEIEFITPYDQGYETLHIVLDTLIETIQGPCVGNQEEFLKGPGLTAARNLLRSLGVYFVLFFHFGFLHSCVNTLFV